MIPIARIALRNVWRNRRRSSVTLSAVFLALAVVVSIRGFVDGLADSVRESAIYGQVGALQIHRQGFLKSLNGASLDLDVPSDPTFMAKIRSVPGVNAATARLSFGAMLNANDATTPAVFSALDPENEPRVCPRRFEAVTAGVTLDKAPVAAGLLAPPLAARVALKPGAKATLLAADRDGAMNALDFDYVADYGKEGLRTPDKMVGVVSLALAQELLRMPARATEIAVSVKNMDDLAAVRAALQAALGAEYEVVTFREVAPWVEEAAAGAHTSLNVLTSVFLFVALLGVVNTMLMSALERTREIGTMMSIGVRKRQILALFLMEAALLGLVGGAFGAAVGGGLVGYYSHAGISFRVGDMATPMHIRPWLELAFLFKTLALAVLGAVLAALWPAYRASRLRPVEALASV